jgi:UDP-N-acetylmuramoylalanine--D-glutamate ligase
VRPLRPRYAEGPLIPDGWRSGEIAVLGLGRTGIAVSEWLANQSLRVYASDAADRPDLREAAEGLRAKSVAVDLGGHDVKRIAAAAAAVVSPGIPPDVPPLRAARDAGIEIFAELDLASRALADAGQIVVTGTNGKTTTTALIAHILTAAGYRAEAAGNIGRPLIAVAMEPQRPDWVVVEASSFQLHDSPSLNPTIGVLTNLAADHLNRYPTVTAYYADKRLLFRNATEDSRWILNGDDGAVRELAAGVPGLRRYWSLEQQADAWFRRSSGELRLADHVLLTRERLPLLGDHNVANALAAALAAVAVGVTPSAVAAALETFRPPPHRLEPVRRLDDVVWINDSKATNVASTLAALRSMEQSYVLIVGGRAKGEDFTVLGPALTRLCRAAVAYGEAGEVLEDTLSPVLPVERVASLQEAVQRCRTVAQAGDAVLLSPACTSFDQFTSFEHRGEAFKALVEEL